MPIQKASLVDVAIDRIKDHIIASNIQPGEKYLSEKELTEKLQVSRTVVREALISLQSFGIITIKRGGGIYLNEQSLDTIKQILHHHYDTYGVKLKELMEIRQVIELGALRLIIEKDIDAGFDVLHQMNQAYYQDIMNQRDTRKNDQLFHRQLMKMTQNETYFTFTEIINDYFSLTKINVNQTQTTLLQSYKEHELFIHFLTTRQLQKAQDMMIKHLQPIITYINDLEEDYTHETNSGQ